MHVYQRLIKTILLGFLLIGMVASPSFGAKYAPYQGKRVGWYFNILHSDSMPTGAITPEESLRSARVIGLKGPYDSSTICQQTRAYSQGNFGPCYERETVEFYRWKTQTTLAWALPIDTGENSKALYFFRKSHCHRVAASGFYFSQTGVKVLQQPDLRKCLVDTVTFKELENWYHKTGEHPLPETAFPKKYIAWSIVVDEGRYRKLLQFRNRENCERVRYDGMYYVKLPRGGFGNITIAHEIPVKHRVCHKRAPLANEVYGLYPHIQEHQILSKQDTPVIKMVKGYRLGVLQASGIVPLYFRQQKDCEKILYSGMYFSGISRGGIWPERISKKFFDQVQGACEMFEVPDTTSWYTYLHKH